MNNDEVYVDAPFYDTHYSNVIEILGKEGIYSFSTAPIRDAISVLQSYTWQRSTNPEHIKNIEQSLREMNKPLLIGTIKVIKCNSVYYVYDGQHRLEALGNVLRDDINMIWNPVINMEIYHFPTETNIKKSEIALYLFKCANKTLSFDKINDSVNDFFKDFLEELVKDKMFVDNIMETDKKINRPKISISELYRELKQYYKPDLYPSIPELIDIFKQKNNHFSTMKEVELIKRGTTRENYLKAKTAKFFLNLASYPPSKWIPELI